MRIEVCCPYLEGDTEISADGMARPGFASDNAGGRGGGGAGETRLAMNRSLWDLPNQHSSY